jgi:hypothetical protein
MARVVEGNHTSIVRRTGVHFKSHYENKTAFVAPQSRQSTKETLRRFYQALWTLGRILIIPCAATISMRECSA